MIPFFGKLWNDKPRHFAEEAEQPTIQQKLPPLTLIFVSRRVTVNSETLKTMEMEVDVVYTDYWWAIIRCNLKISNSEAQHSNYGSIEDKKVSVTLDYIAIDCFMFNKRHKIQYTRRIGLGPSTRDSWEPEIIFTNFSSRMRASS